MPREKVPARSFRTRQSPKRSSIAPAALAPLGNAVQPTVEVEVLERSELAVDERLVGEKADRAARHVDLELASGRRRRAPRRAEAKSSSRTRSAR